MVADALRAGSRVTTSRPSPEVIAATYAELAAAGYSAIVSVHLSERISGTCGAAEIAAGTVAVPVTVVDSRTVGMGAGFAVLSGAEAARGRPQHGAGRRAGHAAGRTPRPCTSTSTAWSILRRGGRIGAAAAVLGSALSVKPLLTVADGEIRAYERVRTASKALARLEELGLAALAQASGAERPRRRGRPSSRQSPRRHSAWSIGCPDRLRGSQVVVTEVSAVLGVHVGPGTLGIVISPRVD